jgi:hypothetical protein
VLIILKEIKWATIEVSMLVKEFKIWLSSKIKQMVEALINHKSPTKLITQIRIILGLYRISIAII